jgi:sulfur carrier protein ThiS
MKIRVKLHGTLRGDIRAGGQAGEIEVEAPEGATAADLLRLLGVAESRAAIVVMDGHVLAPEDRLKAGVPIGVFQAIGGG